MNYKTLRPLTLAICLLACGLASLLLLVSAGDATEVGHKRPRGMNLAPLYQLTKHDGRRLDRMALRGRPFVVAFGFTQCPDVCPTTLLELTNQLAALGAHGDRLAVLFISVDPEHDTVEHLRSYLKSFDPRIIGLTGDPADVAAAALALDAFYERIERKGGGYTVDHTTKIHYFDRFGLLAASIDLLKAPPARVRALLDRLLVNSPGR